MSNDPRSQVPAEVARESTDARVEQGEVRFEESMAELDRIVQLLERGQASLEDSLAAFERGVRLVRQCRQVLDAAELRVRELVDIDADGRATLRPFDHTSSHPSSSDPGQEAGRSPSKRRASSSRRAADPPSPAPDDPDATTDLFGTPGESRDGPP